MPDQDNNLVSIFCNFFQLNANLRRFRFERLQNPPNLAILVTHNQRELNNKLPE